MRFLIPFALTAAASASFSYGIHASFSGEDVDREAYPQMWEGDSFLPKKAKKTKENTEPIREDCVEAILGILEDYEFNKVADISQRRVDRAIEPITADDKFVCFGIVARQLLDKPELLRLMGEPSQNLKKIQRWTDEEKDKRIARKGAAILQSWFWPIPEDIEVQTDEQSTA